MMYNYKYVLELKINSFVFKNETIRPLQEAENLFLWIFFKNSGGFFSMMEVEYINLNSLFRGVKTIFWAKVVYEV